MDQQLLLNLRRNLDAGMVFFFFFFFFSKTADSILKIADSILRAVLLNFYTGRTASAEAVFQTVFQAAFQAVFQAVFHFVFSV